MATVYEKLKKIDGLKQYKRKVDQLAEGNNYVMRTILQLNFDKNIDLGFPEGAPPYKQNEEKFKDTDKKVISNFGAVMQKGDHQWAREKVFIDILEALNYNDSELICKCKDKKLEEVFPTITKELVAEAIPQLKQIL